MRRTYTPYGVNPTRNNGRCCLEKCILDKANQLAATGWRMTNYKKYGPNSNSFTNKLVRECEGITIGDPEGNGAVGWSSVGNIQW